MYVFEGTSRLGKLDMWPFFFPIRGKTAKPKPITSVTLRHVIIPPEHLPVRLLATSGGLADANACFLTDWGWA